MPNPAISEAASGFAFAWATTPARLAIAAGSTLIFAALAHAVRGVSRRGALAGGVACLILFAALGPAGFAVLTALFVLTWLATRIGHRDKLERGLAERREGRNAWQVLANLSVAAIAAGVFAIAGHRVWMIAAIGAMVEAATDTVASEIGQGRRLAILITTWKAVPAGTDGGVTLAGTTAGALAGMLQTAIAGLTGLIPARELWIPALAGFLGMLADSLLGATWQRQGWISNQGVNLVSTLAAACLAAAVLHAAD